jgi:SWIM zinc finger
MSLTMEGVLALAPDDASAKAARGLTSPAKWPLLGANESALWGECQGSGSKPYQTQVDLSGPAFKCSCPSRKFPCKHGLALLLMRVQTPASLSATEPPAWVAEWLLSRHERAEKKEERDRDTTRRAESRAAQRETGDAAGATDEASLKREAQRWQRIEAAAQELQRWLGDQIGRGLGALDAASIQGWRTMAARMVDAQAPGLGQRLLAAADVWRQSADWPERMIVRLGLLQLATEALTRREQLPAPVQADLRTLCGWPVDQADVLASGERVDDRWAVLAAVIEEREGRLMERRVWLQGEQTGRRAWLLEHAHGGKGFNGLWVPGTAVVATLAMFPGASPMRALVVQRQEEGDALNLQPMTVAPPQLSAPLPSRVPAPAGQAVGVATPINSNTRRESKSDKGRDFASGISLACTSDATTDLTTDLPTDPWAAEWQRVAERIAAHPFVLLHPMVLTGAVAVVTEAGAQLLAGGQALPLSMGDQERWLLMAASGGHPITVAGEWDGERLLPLTAWSGADPRPIWIRSQA